MKGSQAQGCLRESFSECRDENDSGRTNIFWGQHVQGFTGFANAVAVGGLFGGWGGMR